MAAPPPTGLPVEASVPPVRAALADRGGAVLQASPGAGKTTVVPLRLVDEPWLAGRRIVVLEPRRLAARAAAHRMAALLGEPVGDTVGYVTRDERRVGRGTRVEVVTEGILTRRLQHDPTLAGIGLVVFDEVHERNLQTDLALALTLDVHRSIRPDLRLLAMSATIEVDRVASLLGGDEPVPVVESAGRAFPVDLVWAPPRPRQRPAEAVAGVVVRAVREAEGDVLVFLPGAGDIRRVEALLAAPGAGLPSGIDVRPLFGALSAGEQDAALAPSTSGRRRIVLATDIAETSLTVAGVRVVVDGGESRTPRYDPRTGLTRLHTGPISRASADQRAGRAGRTAPGVAYRCWSKLEHAARRPFADPEIASVDLAGFVLELAVWGAGAGDLAFLDPPPPRALAEGRALLFQLGAVDGSGRPTATGRAMADLPLHPRLAAMVVGARTLGQGWGACVLAALLEDRDVFRGRPDDVPVDLAERVRAVLERGTAAGAGIVDRGALAGARRRADQLARRADVPRREVDLRRLGRLLALAYPDRVAQARGGARFRLRSGGGAWVPAGDALAGEPLLVVADLDAGARDSRVRLAAGLDASDLADALGAEATVVTTLAWDLERDDLRATTTRQVGALDLDVTSGPAPPGPATTAALLDRVRATGLAVLPWTDGARSLQDRVGFLRRTFGDPWPDMSDEALRTDLEGWLAPFLGQATGRTGLARVDVATALRARLPYDQQRGLDRLAPPTVEVAPGRPFRIDYGGEQPTISARVQELFGVTRHPTVAEGRVPVLVALLSPARRPVQLTADLPGFWAGTYADVRKDLAGRYPKHPWPADPASADPPSGRRR